MAANSQQFGVCVDSSRRFNEVIYSNIETKLSELTSLVRQVALGQVRQAKVCTILLINVLNYKMMTCLKLMSWVDLIANKEEMTYFIISTPPGGTTTRT
jgi:hypothetical protein